MSSNLDSYNMLKINHPNSNVTFKMMGFMLLFKGQIIYQMTTISIKTKIHELSKHEFSVFGEK